MPRFHILVERETLWYGEVVIEADSEDEAREALEAMKARPDESPIQWEIQTDDIITTDFKEVSEEG